MARSQGSGVELKRKGGLDDSEWWVDNKSSSCPTLNVSGGMNFEILACGNV